MPTTLLKTSTLPPIMTAVRIAPAMTHGMKLITIHQGLTLIRCSAQRHTLWWDTLGAVILGGVNDKSGLG